MAYTLEQLTLAWTAVHNGIAPDAATTAALDAFVNLSPTNAEVLGYIIDSADDSTAVAVLSYQFFTGKSPTEEGLDYLLNSSANPNDLGDAYYAKFNLENRYISFAANLGVQGEGADDFAAKYGAMSFSDYVASIYETIIGKTAAKAAGVDVDAAIAYLIGRHDAVLLLATEAGMVTPDMTAAQIDLAVKAAMAGLVMAASIKADIGVYAAASNNFAVALARGDAVYGADLVETYGPAPGSHGTGSTIDNAPSDLPGAPDPVPPVEPPPPAARNFVLTLQNDRFTGQRLNDTFTGDDTTLNAGDVLTGGDGRDSLTLTASGAFILASATVSGIETVGITSGGAVDASIRSWTGVETLDVTAVGAALVSAANTTDITLNVSGQNDTLSVQGGHDVTIETTGAIAGVGVTVGGALDVTGAVQVTTITGDAIAQGQIMISGGTTIEVTQIATNVTGTHTNAAVRVNGRVATSEVTLTATPAGAHNAANTVQIFDLHDPNATTKGTITKVSIDGATDVTITDNALGTLDLAHVNGAVSLVNTSALATPDKTTSLDLSVSGVIASAISDSGVYTQLDITTGADASDLGRIEVWAVEKATITGAGDLTADFSGPSNLTEIDASTSTGDNTITLDGIRTDYAGGSGVDNVTLTNTRPITASIDGGDGATDQVSIKFAALLSNPSYVHDRVEGFERLALTNVTFPGSIYINLMYVGDYNWVSTTGLDFGGGSLTVYGFNTGGTLAILGDTVGAGGYVIDGADFGAGDDAFNLVLSKAGALDPGVIWISGVETLNITTLDTQATPTHVTHSVDLELDDTETITISGDAGLTLYAGAAGLTLVDASEITAGDFIWTTGALAGAATIKGSATGTNTVDFSAAQAVVTYTGGTGDDLVNGSHNHDNTIDLGAGDNEYTGGAAEDHVEIAGNGTNTVSLGVDNAEDSVLIHNGNSISAYLTIDNVSTGDSLEFGGAGSPVGIQAETVIGSGTPTLRDYIDAASAGDGSTTALVQWFQFGGDTYIVYDVSVGGFSTGDDYLVKLVGEIDVSAADLTGHTLTFVGGSV